MFGLFYCIPNVQEMEYTFSIFRGATGGCCAKSPRPDSLAEAPPQAHHSRVCGLSASPPGAIAVKFEIEVMMILR